tara:strand:+ start:245 stop:1087 length:843 start_codon:yes stop_codon:yes gene_type:complete
MPCPKCRNPLVDTFSDCLRCFPFSDSVYYKNSAIKQLHDESILKTGSSLSYAVRQMIPYSENIKALIRGRDNSPVWNERRDLVYSKRSERSSGKFHVDAKLSHILSSGVGYCGEIAYCVVELAKMIPPLNGELYATELRFYDSHCFILLHQDRGTHDAVNSQGFESGEIVKDLKELSEITELRNAVIVDPWVYKSTKLTDWKRHMDHVNTFDASVYYRTRVWLQNNSGMLGEMLRNTDGHAIIKEAMKHCSYALSNRSVWSEYANGMPLHSIRKKMFGSW